MPLDGYAGARWLATAAVVTLVGVAVLPALLSRSLPDSPLLSTIRRRAAGLGLLAAVLLLLATCLRLWYQTRSFLEPGEPLTGEMLGLVLGSGPWGTGWKLQAAIALALVLAWATPGLRRMTGLHRLLVLGLAVVTPLAGHAVSAPEPGRALGLHALHLLGTGAWLGTLLALAWAAFPVVLAQPPESREARMGALLRTFSPVALTGAGVAAGTGGVLAWGLVGSPGALVASGYGRWLLVKLALVAIVVGIGYRNWRTLTPRLGTGAAEPLARSARVELGVGALVLLATAILVALEAPGL